MKQKLLQFNVMESEYFNYTVKFSFSPFFGKKIKVGTNSGTNGSFDAVEITLQLHTSVRHKRRPR